MKRVSRPVATLLGALPFLPLAGCYLIPDTTDAHRPHFYTYYTDRELPPDHAGASAPLLDAADNGYLIGQLPDRNDQNEANQAADQARKSPATPQQARQSATADLNKNGFVTLDEVVAMRDAGLDDQEMIRRLLATGQVFRLTAAQEDYLINHGVSRAVIDRLRPPSPPTTDTKQ